MSTSAGNPAGACYHSRVADLAQHRARIRQIERLRPAPFCFPALVRTSVRKSSSAYVSLDISCSMPGIPTTQRPFAGPGARVCFMKRPTTKPTTLLRIGTVPLGLGGADNGGPRASVRDRRSALRRRNRESLRAPVDRGGAGTASPRRVPGCIARRIPGRGLRSRGERPRPGGLVLSRQLVEY